MAALVTLVPAAWSALAKEKVDIRVVSSRPDMVSGGDALIKVTGVASTPASPAVSLAVNGRDVTKAFTGSRSPRTRWRV